MAQAKGSLAQLIAQLEPTYRTTPSGANRVRASKVYLSSETLAFNQSFEESTVMRGASRQPTAPLRGKTDVAGGISTELMAATPLYHAALGSFETTMTGGTMGTALTSPTAVINSVTQTMTVTVTGHGLVTGDNVEIAALTAPTTLNGKIFPVIDVPTANTFVLRIPMGTGSTFTLGSGTIKKVTAPGTVFTHTFKSGGALPSYSMEKGFLDLAVPKYFLYRGCKCGKISFSIGSSGLIALSSDWMGAAENDPADTSFESGTPYDAGKASFDNLGIAAADMLYAGSAVANILSIDGLTIENQLDGDTFVVGGGGARGAINEGTNKISGTIKAIFDDVSYYSDAKALTERSLDFTIKRGTGAGTAGNETMQVVISELVLVPKAPAISGPAGIVQEYSLTGYYNDHADGAAVKIIIKNATPPSGMV